MPELKDTELRILLLALRMSAGWGRTNYPVTLSYRVIKKRTGRQSAAISAALASLSERGLIHMVPTSRTQQAHIPKELPSECEQHI